jgi:hypothetical protein
MKRNPRFYMTYYIVPSVLFVVIAYCSFWIDQNAAAARCALSITTILITIQFSNGLNNILPPIDYSVWIEDYFKGILIFTCFAMFEYAFVNFTNLNYISYQKRIDETIANIKVNLSKLKQKVLKVKEEREKYKIELEFPQSQKDKS